LSRKLFIIGFVLGLVLFVAVNIYSYIVAEPPCCDLSTSFGFPIPLGTFGGFVGNTAFLLPGLIADTLIGLAASLVFGRTFAKLLPPIANLFRQAVRWHVSTRS
jgi:hypothetical protein